MLKRNRHLCELLLYTDIDIINRAYLNRTMTRQHVMQYFIVLKAISEWTQAPSESTTYHVNVLLIFNLAHQGPPTLALTDSNFY